MAQLDYRNLTSVFTLAIGNPQYVTKDNEGICQGILQNAENNDFAPSLKGNPFILVRPPGLESFFLIVPLFAGYAFLKERKDYREIDIGFVIKEIKKYFYDKEGFSFQCSQLKDFIKARSTTNKSGSRAGARVSGVFRTLADNNFITLNLVDFSCYGLEYGDLSDYVRSIISKKISDKNEQKAGPALEDLMGEGFGEEDDFNTKVVSRLEKIENNSEQMLAKVDVMLNMITILVDRQSNIEANQATSLAPSETKIMDKPPSETSSDDDVSTESQVAYSMLDVSKTWNDITFQKELQAILDQQPDSDFDRVTSEKRESYKPALIYSLFNPVMPFFWEKFKSAPAAFKALQVSNLKRGEFSSADLVGANFKSLSTNIGSYKKYRKIYDDYKK